MKSFKKLIQFYAILISDDKELRGGTIESWTVESCMDLCSLRDQCNAYFWLQGQKVR